jgi:multiple antibiotic resistance protein
MGQSYAQITQADLRVFVYTFSAMTAFANAFLLVFAGLFPILNPVGTAPIFLALTSSCTEAERTALARRVAINSVLLLAGSMFIGSYLLVFFGITLPVVRIAGGLVLTAFGWKLLHDGVEREDNRSSEAKSHSTAIDSFYPLTMPLTVGPGSIAVAIGLGSQRPEGSLTLSQVALLGGSAIAGVVALTFTVYVCYRFAKRTTALLGENGVNVVIRLSAFILLCIGIQVLWTGYSTLVLAPRA